MPKASVEPLSGGPYIVDAWTLTPAIYHGDANRCTAGKTFVRVMWSNGLTAYPTGAEVGAPVVASYRAIYKLPNGKVAAVAPLDVADLHDHASSANADNMHDLCLPQAPPGTKLTGVTIGGGLIQDPNGDPNVAQKFRASRPGTASATATATAPIGPRLAVGVSHPYPLLSEIKTVGPTGADPVRLVSGKGEGVIRPNGGQPAWSPDGSLLAFTGSFGEYSPVIYVVGADGGRPRLVSKAEPLSDPIFSPDGRSLVFSALRVVKGEFQRTARRADDDYGVVVDWAVMAVNVNSGRPRLLTPWRRNQILTPTSFSPDGSKLAAEGVTLKRGAAVFEESAAVTVELGGGPTTILARNAEEPVYSPDGTRVAFVHTKHGAPPKSVGNRPPARSDLFVMPAAGGGPVKLASVRGGLAWPSWDPSGQRISFTRLGGGSLGGLPHPHESNAVMEINADGTCLTRLLPIGRGNFNGSSWQPGLGREAGPIAC